MVVPLVHLTTEQFSILPQTILDEVWPREDSSVSGLCSHLASSLHGTAMWIANRSVFQTVSDVPKRIISVFKAMPPEGPKIMWRRPQGRTRCRDYFSLASQKMPWCPPGRAGGSSQGEGGLFMNLTTVLNKSSDTSMYKHNPHGSDFWLFMSSSFKELCLTRHTFVFI